MHKNNIPLSLKFSSEGGMLLCVGERHIAISMCLRMAVRVMMPMISILPLKV